MWRGHHIPFPFVLFCVLFLLFWEFRTNFTELHGKISVLGSLFATVKQRNNKGRTPGVIGKGNWKGRMRCQLLKPPTKRKTKTTQWFKTEKQGSTTSRIFNFHVKSFMTLRHISAPLVKGFSSRQGTEQEGRALPSKAPCFPLRNKTDVFVGTRADSQESTDTWRLVTSADRPSPVTSSEREEVSGFRGVLVEAQWKGSSPNFINTKHRERQAPP